MKVHFALSTMILRNTNYSAEMEIEFPKVLWHFFPKGLRGVGNSNIKTLQNIYYHLVYVICHF